jgi:hypothetical protein
MLTHLQHSDIASKDTVNQRNRELCEEIYFNRWANLQLDGTIEALDDGIQGMVYCGQLLIDGQDVSSTESLLDDVEFGAYWTKCKLEEILALETGRCSYLPFDAGHLLSSAVGQYLLYLPQCMHKTIIEGVELANKCRGNLFQPDELSQFERDYREWVIPRLISHLIFDPYD